MDETNGSTPAKTAATKRSTAAKKSAATRASRQGATARKRTTTAATKRVTEIRADAEREATEAAAAGRRGAAGVARELATPVVRVREAAERIALAQLGAALVARDSVTETVDTLRTAVGSREGAEKELELRRRRLEAELKRFERRGATARDTVEQDIKGIVDGIHGRGEKVTSELKGLRTDLTKQAAATRKDVLGHAELVSARAQNLVQTGITRSTQAAAKVQERLASVA